LDTYRHHGRQVCAEYLLRPCHRECGTPLDREAVQCAPDDRRTAGFGGQKFLPEMLPKIRELRRLCESRRLDPWIEVDGGEDAKNAALAIAAGADAIVAGTAIFGSDDYAAAIARIRNSTAHMKVVAQ
jgi:orotidine-5'-phosphate decarboxylase